jgi:hypothetical protein
MLPIAGKANAPDRGAIARAWFMLVLSCGKLTNASTIHRGSQVHSATPPITSEQRFEPLIVEVWY